METAARVRTTEGEVFYLGHDPEEVNYMDLHIDAIKNPTKAGIENENI